MNKCQQMSSNRLMFNELAVILSQINKRELYNQLRQDESAPNDYSRVPFAQWASIERQGNWRRIRQYFTWILGRQTAPNTLLRLNRKSPIMRIIRTGRRQLAVHSRNRRYQLRNCQIETRAEQWNLSIIDTDFWRAVQTVRLLVSQSGVGTKRH